MTQQYRVLPSLSSLFSLSAHWPGLAQPLKQVLSLAHLLHTRLKDGHTKTFQMLFFSVTYFLPRQATAPDKLPPSPQSPPPFVSPSFVAESWPSSTPESHPCPEQPRPSDFHSPPHHTVSIRRTVVPLSPCSGHTSEALTPAPTYFLSPPPQPLSHANMPSVQ